MLVLNSLGHNNSINHYCSSKLRISGQNAQQARNPTGVTGHCIQNKKEGKSSLYTRRLGNSVTAS